MLIEHLVQIMIALFGLTGLIALAANRIFLGCILALIGESFWIWSSYTTEQWGSVSVLAVYLIVYLLGIVTRWPRKAPPPQPDPVPSVSKVVPVASISQAAVKRALNNHGEK